ncbi:hypothetical protein CVV68_03765 [Arthrobacter livingstonensis]|uniref:Uncharacterized protein n=1 Tax=Arthrobacter livingstonensis TaxID=670078 RepID=A0A2V5M1B0_9MICC|nr:hypothetical protein CVV68_03765 [Arthrobacter livingstonensis]
MRGEPGFDILLAVATAEGVEPVGVLRLRRGAVDELGQPVSLGGALCCAGQGEQGRAGLGKVSSRSAAPRRAAAAELFNSCAMPALRRPSVASFSLWMRAAERSATSSSSCLW